MQENHTQSSVPSWIVAKLGKLVQINEPVEGYPRGRRGLLLSVCTKSRWGQHGVYATVALNLRDISDETNVELSSIDPTPVRIR